MSATAASPVVLILGSGSNIGANVAKTFAAKGYKVASAARRLNNEKKGDNELHIQSDFSDPESVVSAFSKVQSTFGPPSVVIYNAASSTNTPPKDPLDFTLSNFNKDITINATSVAVAAREAVRSFERLPATASRTFIFTGNALNTEVIYPMLVHGMGKSATAHLIHAASGAYKDKGYKFYYADERTEEGYVAGGKISGPAHAEFYLQLAEDKEQGPWLATFVKGKGYVDFAGKKAIRDPSS